MATSSVSVAPAASLGLRQRFQALAIMLSILSVGVLATSAAEPMIASKLALRADVANSIAQIIGTLGSIPWWALLIVGAGIAGTVVSLVVRFGVRYAAAW